jgi:hypothetical protein
VTVDTVPLSVTVAASTNAPLMVDAAMGAVIVTSGSSVSTISTCTQGEVVTAPVVLVALAHIW